MGAQPVCDEIGKGTDGIVQHAAFEHHGGNLAGGTMDLTDKVRPSSASPEAIGVGLV
jgi:hypothetical protein